MRNSVILNAAIILITLTSNFALAQNQHTDSSPIKADSYVYLSVEGKLFTKKLKVQVDFGDFPEQLEAGKEYSNYLTNKKSYAAVLNYMVEKQFELVQALELTTSHKGTGGTSGIVFIMKKKE
jgi:hypothetical protein